MVPKRFLLVTGTFLLSLLLYIDRVCISTARGPITHDLALTDKQFGWVLSAFALGYALLQTPSGAFADRFGPRRILASIVAFWSLFTGLTAAAWSFASLLVVRFLFGAGEAGAFPSITRAVYSWVPMKERGVVTGANFAGSRLGAAFAMPVVAGLIVKLGWRDTFLLLMGTGFAWAIYWYWWFRDTPEDHPRISDEEKDYILRTRQPEGPKVAALPLAVMLRSRNMWLAMLQYFASNFTFFFCLSWLFPYLKKTYDLTTVEAGWYASAPFVAGALGNVFAGAFIDAIYRRGQWKLSRALPAGMGFGLAALGLIASVKMGTPAGAVLWLSVAIFGADMTLSPSWAFCTDIGRRNAGAVSGTMNMAGNLGSFVTSLAFPYLLAWTGTHTVFFYVAAALNVMAVLLWTAVKPDEPLETADTPAASPPMR